MTIAMYYRNRRPQRSTTNRIQVHSRMARVRAGFTLAEVMVATLVLAFAIATSITTLAVGFRQLDTARNTTLAGQVLQSLVEDVRLMPYSTTGGVTGISALPTSLEGPVGTFDSTNSFTSLGTQASAMLSRFTVKRTIAGPSVTGQAGMYKITFEAQWSGIDGKSHTVKYTTYYAQNGLYDYYYN